MASFKASNIETDDESDDEQDDTKEIQIEEALKVYQSAVKLQSQGKEFLKETGDAYRTLFESDVFAYPESWSEYRRVETYGEQLYEEGPWQYEQESRTDTPVVGVENAPSTLPQVLHLSYKNRALHYLDVVRASLASGTASQDIRMDVSKALDDFTEALDKDGDDVDLWRRAAKISQVLKSYRISRYCLEAVVEGDEQGTDETLGGLGMEVKLADYDLDQIIQKFNDDMWRNRTSTAGAGVPATWRKQLSLYPYLPEVPERSNLYDAEVIEARTERSWSAIGETIYKRLVAELEGSAKSKPEAPWKIVVPEKTVISRVSLIPLNTENLQGLQASAAANPMVTSPEDMSAGREEPKAVANQQNTSPGEQLESEQQEQLQQIISMDSLSRKRSSEAAELPEEPEGGRVRSKRLRAKERESTTGEGQQNDLGAMNGGLGFDEKILASIEADEWLSDILKAIVEKIGVNGFSLAKPYRSLVTPSSASAPDPSTSSLPLCTAVKDFYAATQNWNQNKTKKLLQSSLLREAAANTPSTGLSVFFEQYSTNRQRATTEDFDTGLARFVKSVSGTRHRCTATVAFSWVCSLLSSNTEGDLGNSSYMVDAWPATLKDIFAKIIVITDELLYYRFRRMFDEINRIATHADKDDRVVKLGSMSLILLDISQSLFESHLDIYVSNADPDAKVDDTEKLQQRVRLNKWGGLARDAISLHHDERLWNAANNVDSQFQRLRFRHLWASVHHLKVLEEVDREHLVLCIEDLKTTISSFADPVIELPNNSAMPEMSVAAADGELSKLETMDFFVGIFQKEGKSAVDLIESLEPLLEQTIQPRNETNTLVQPDAPGVERSLINHRAQIANGSDTLRRQPRSTSEILTKFVASSSAALRLSLWHRLLESYEAIEYPSKVFSIHLRCIQVVMEELTTEKYAQKAPEEREETLLDTLRDLREMLKNTLQLTTQGANVFETLDLDHLRMSIKAVTQLWTLLYTVGLYDDYSQAGGKGGPSVNPFRFYPSGSFHAASVKLHDMQIQTSVLLYKLIVEAMKQMPEEFPNADEVKLDYLRHMHYHFGVRRICKASDGLFLLLMQDELISFTHLRQQSSNDLAQVLHDLYDLNCFSSPLDRHDHGCDSDYLDRKTAMQLIDFVMDKAKLFSVKDLLKSDLGKTMEKLHTTLGIVKSNFAALRNRSFYTSFLRSPIRPLQLLRSLDGIVDLPTVPVSPEEGLIASKGWYLLKGQISLAKHRAQRAKSSQGSEEDLNDAIAFFMQDLEFDSEQWETWYRLAQAHDCLFEEQILWSAEKLNNKRSELADLQRSTIQSYLMATAVANRAAEPSPDTAAKLSELYTDFAVCVYSATRQPFAMRAFALQDAPFRHFTNAEVENGQYTAKPFQPLIRSVAWKFAIALLKRAARFNPNRWVVHYMLGKCLWKLHSRSDRLEKSRVAVQAAFLRAIETLPPRKEQIRQEPILEPIYKSVSITHKLVQRKEMDPEQGSNIMEDILLKQKQIDVSKRPRFAESQSWNSYVIDVLKMLRTADKPRWHHRLVIRAAQLIHDQPEANGGGAQAAKDYLVDQHIYSTKTYALQIWKPEHERSGRHWVYTQQYALFLTRLLGETYDVEGIQLLAKRLRRKQNDFFEHTILWEYICEKHVAIHRHYGNIRPDCSDFVFKHLDQEEFAKRADLIDAWVCGVNNTHKLFEVLRESAELKKLNAALVKPTVIDDLLADTYAEIWAEFGPSLWRAQSHAPVDLTPTTAPEAPESPPKEELSKEDPHKEELSKEEPSKEDPPKEERRNIMSLTNLINIDGTSDYRHSQAATPTPSQPDQAMTRNRPRLISKREIVKRATDVILNRPATKAASPQLKPAPEPSDTANIKVVINQLPGGGAAEGNGDSLPGSLHDSADDESELSEVEDDDEDETAPVIVRPMFPNLHPRSPGATSSQGAGDSADGAGRSGGDPMDED